MTTEKNEMFDDETPSTESETGAPEIVQEQTADSSVLPTETVTEETPESAETSEPTEDQPQPVEFQDDSATEPVIQPSEGEINDQLEFAQPEDEQKQENQTQQIYAHEDNVETSVESVIEAVLFTNDEPIADAKLASIVELGSVKQVRDAIETLNNKYRANNIAFRIEKIAGGYQMLTLSVYNPWLQKLVRVRTDSKLSQAALEALAIVAYKQPIIRADIEAIRGVASGEVLRSLMFKGLVKIVGRAEIIGRPMLYGTTKRFLEIFGLSSLKDLPKIEELKKPQ